MWSGRRILISFSLDFEWNPSPDLQSSSPSRVLVCSSNSPLVQTSSEPSTSPHHWLRTFHSSRSHSSSHSSSHLFIIHSSALIHGIHPLRPCIALIHRIHSSHSFIAFIHRIHSLHSSHSFMARRTHSSHSFFSGVRSAAK
jgi:hypothetical protein